MSEFDRDLLDTRETHWKDMHEYKSSLVNLQRMVWPRVKREWKNIFTLLSPLRIN